MIKKLGKIELSFNTCAAFSIFCLGGILSIGSFEPIAQAFKVGMLIAGSLGTIYLLFGRLRSQPIVFPNPSMDKLMFPLSRFRSLILLIIVQCLFLGLTWIFFYTFESQTRITGRLQALEPGQLISILSAHPWTLGFAPWMLTAVFGVGLAYYSVCFERSPTIPTVMFKDPKKHPMLFFQYYSQVVLDTVQQMPFVILLCLTILWCLEALNISFGWPSIFLYPWRANFSFMLIILVFRKSHHKFLDWAIERRLPLGAILGFYAIGISTIMFWMHSFGSGFTFGTEVTDPNLVMKSALAGSFSSSVLENRLELLIWGWWGIWMPSLAGIISRLSFGLKVHEACLNVLILPLFFFIVMMNKMELAYFQSFFPSQLPVLSHWLIFAFLLCVIMFSFGKVYTTADIARGAMPLLGMPLRARLLRKWIGTAMGIFVTYFLGILMLGWVPVQVIGTLGTGFMLSVFFIFLFVLLSAKAPSSDEVKYKVLSES